MMPNVSKSEQKILIVDDDKSVLQVLAKILQKAGYNITTVETGHEALTKLQTQSYDAALIDVRLQDTNGLDLLERIQTVAPDMTKIMLTGYPSDQDRIKALRLGADDYLAKPVKSETLIETIETKLREKDKATQNQIMTTNVDFTFSTESPNG